MQPITKSEMEFIIEHDILKCVHGKYNGLITGSKKKHGLGKPRYIEDPIYFQMLKLQEQQKVDKS